MLKAFKPKKSDDCRDGEEEPMMEMISLFPDVNPKVRKNLNIFEVQTREALFLHLRVADGVIQYKKKEITDPD
jgi:hypothetical protein